MQAATPAPRHIGGINTIGMLALARAQLPFFWQMKEWWISDFIFVPMYMVIVTVVLGDNIYEVEGLDYISYIAYGLLISTCFLRSFECAAYILSDLKIGGFLPHYVQAPMVGWEFMAVWNLSYLVYAMTEAVCLMAVLLLFGMVVPNLSFANLAVLGLFCVSACGMGHFAALLSHRWDHIVGVDTFAILPLIMLSGVFFPPSALPQFFMPFYDYNPFFLVIDGLRKSFAFSADLGGVAVLAAAMAVVSFVASVVCWNKGWGVKK